MLLIDSSIPVTNEKKSSTVTNRKGIAIRRIDNRFMELLESQFPIRNVRDTVLIKTPSDFAEKINIHVNHLNRTLKTVHKKTTTVLIQERILKESKRLLVSTNWNISEIAYSLGFKEVTHFNNFFKKLEGTNPSTYRNIEIIKNLE